MISQNAILTPRFGEVVFTTQDVVRFQDGIVGFPGLREFVVIQHKEGSPFRWLQSIDQPEMAFLVVDPAVYSPDYAPEMPSGLVATLQLSEATPRLVYTIVTIPRGKPQEMTLNLAGPIVINAETGCAAQVVLQDDAYPVRYAIFPQPAAA